MPDEMRDFGLALAIAAQAIGEPGNRTFRLLVRNESATATLWLEKEQLQALAIAADELLAQVGLPPHGTEQLAQADPEQDFRARPAVEFKVGQLSIGYDEAGKFFLLLAHGADEDPEDPASFRCLLSRPQLSGLGKQAHEVIAAGRPRCALCGAPLEPAPHFCPPSNGHAQAAQIG